MHSYGENNLSSQKEISKFLPDYSPKYHFPMFLSLRNPFNDQPKSYMFLLYRKHQIFVKRACLENSSLLQIAGQKLFVENNCWQLWVRRIHPTEGCVTEECEVIEDREYSQ